MDERTKATPPLLPDKKIGWRGGGRGRFKV